MENYRFYLRDSKADARTRLHLDPFFVGGRHVCR